MDSGGERWQGIWVGRMERLSFIRSNEADSAGWGMDAMIEPMNRGDWRRVSFVIAIVWGTEYRTLFCAAPSLSSRYPPISLDLKPPWPMLCDWL